MRALLQFVAILSLAIASGARADSITLRASAQATLGAPLRLADVATLEGADAQRLAETVIVADAREKVGQLTRFEIALDDVRDVLASADVNWGRVTLRGSTCTVRVRAPREAPTTDSDEPALAAHHTPAGPVVRDAVRSAVRSALGVEDENLRIEWDDRDEAFLRRSSWGIRIETQPTTSGSSARQTIVVRLYEGQALLEERSVRADVEINTAVLTLKRQIERRESIRTEDLATQRVWITPDGSRPIGKPTEAVGRVAESRLEAGLILRESHVEQPIAVERGERVIVHCISGGIALKAKARALADGRIGQFVEMRLEGRNGTFMARVSGHGVAVLNLDAGAPTRAEESM
jgi:flagella basal body P-ring formation protein FlgA